MSVSLEFHNVISSCMFAFPQCSLQACWLILLKISICLLYFQVYNLVLFAQLLLNAAVNTTFGLKDCCLCCSNSSWSCRCLQTPLTFSCIFPKQWISCIVCSLCFVLLFVWLQLWTQKTPFWYSFPLIIWNYYYYYRTGVSQTLHMLQSRLHDFFAWQIQFSGGNSGSLIWFWVFYYIIIWSAI